MSKRILVIEDQLDNRQILRDLLTSADYISGDDLRAARDISVQVTTPAGQARADSDPCGAICPDLPKVLEY